MIETLVIAFTVGFFGGMHCIGMCGGLVSALSMTRPKVWWSGLTAYQFGRVTTYTIFGLITGLIGISLKQLGGFEQIQFGLTLFAGLIMITFGLNLAGLMPDPFARFGARAIGGLGLANRIKAAASSHNPVSWYGIGIANGLLPCGLVYVALGLSIASGDVVEATATMFAFGLGTIPAMMVAPALVNMIAASKRGLIMKVLGVLVIILGLLTMIRGTSLMHMLHGGGAGHAGHEMSSGHQVPMDHSGMNHGTMDHGAMDQQPATEAMPMDHSGMDHGAMDHGTMDHQPATEAMPMDHSGMNHGTMGHSTMQQQPAAGVMPMDHSGMDHGAMDQPPASEQPL